MVDADSDGDIEGLDGLLKLLFSGVFVFFLDFLVIDLLRVTEIRNV
jgi:hypothetical protein